MTNTSGNDALRERIRELEAELGKLESKFLRSDILEMRFDSIKTRISHLEEKVAELVLERQWLLRIFLGAIVMAVIGLVLNKNGVV